MALADLLARYGTGSLGPDESLLAQLLGQPSENDLVPRSAAVPELPQPQFVDQPAEQAGPQGGGVFGRLGEAFGPSPFHAQADLRGQNGGIGGLIALAAVLANSQVNKQLNAKNEAEAQNERAAQRTLEINKENRQNQRLFDAETRQRRQREADASRARQEKLTDAATARTQKLQDEADERTRNSITLPGGQVVPISSAVGQKYLARQAGLDKESGGGDLESLLNPGQRLRLGANERRFKTRVDQMQTKITEIGAQVEQATRQRDAAKTEGARVAAENLIGRLAAKSDSLTAELNGVRKKWAGSNEAVIMDLKPPGASERKELAADVTAFRQASTIAGLYNPAFVGRIQGPLGTAQSFTGLGLAPGEAAFRAALAQYRNAVINALSGAAVSESEAKRMQQQIPQEGDPPEVFEAKMHQTEGNLRQVAEERRKLFTETGLDLSQLEDLPEISSTAIRRNAPGRVRRVNGKLVRVR